MAELIVVFGVIGVIALVAWPVLRSWRGRRAQPTLTDRRPHPPRRPDTPIPGSQPHREQHGKP